MERSIIRSIYDRALDFVRKRFLAQAVVGQCPLRGRVEGRPPRGHSLVSDAKLWLAIVALVQPWLIALWKKFLLRGRIRAYPSANIEIGFSTFGPTVALQGTLHASHRDIFVTSAGMVVTRE